MTEEGTINLEIQRLLALGAEDAETVLRKVVVSESADNPLRRVVSNDFFHHFA